MSFLLPVTMTMHNFWAVADAATSQIEKAMFMKNVTMLGGALLISYFGAGPLSLDGLLKSSPRNMKDDAVSPRGDKSCVTRRKCACTSHSSAAAHSDRFMPHSR